MPTPDVTTRDDASVTRRLPLRFRESFVLRSASGVVSVLEIRWMTIKRWRSIPVSSFPNWTTIAVGPFILSFRIIG
jgi:hypothetical protein